jgi:hypothetical protein
VDWYIKAFFYDPLLDAIKEKQTEYTSKQLTGLATCVNNHRSPKFNRDWWKALEDILSKKKD